MATLFRILVFTQALLLALPPGWCCAAPQSEAAEEPVPATGCPDCGHQDRQADETPGPCSQRPVDPCCCCCVKAAIPAGQLKITAAASFSAPVSLAADAMAYQGLSRSATSGLPPPGPSLQILHCIWRC